jgi:hypothetical protein
MNIGVVKENVVVNARDKHGFHHLTRTRCAAGVQEHLGFAVWEG